MYDIAFLSFNELNANNLYFKFLKKIADLPNRVYRIHGVQGIHQAHVAAAKLASTSMFWVVDADADVLPDFKFDTKLDPSEEDIVHVWRSKNPINDLEYGYGGVKLLPTNLTLNMDMSSPDMTTSISPRFKSVPQVSNITAFNTDELTTWRSAFRECVKLASGLISGQISQETEKRLNVWKYNFNDKPFAEYARGGASAGEWYGIAHKNNPEALFKINDYEWLEIEFGKHIIMFPDLYPTDAQTLKHVCLERERERELELESLEVNFTIEQINRWKDAFREAANTNDAARLDTLLHRGIDEYARGGASAGNWWRETYQDDPEKMQQITDDRFLVEEFYWHVENYPLEQFRPDPLICWRSAFREAANTTDAAQLDDLLYRGIDEYARSGASAGKWWGETYRDNAEKMQQITDDKFLEGEFYWHIENNPVEQFK
jgi:hypothetical protein